jgi:hypothetical protein
MIKDENNQQKEESVKLRVVSIQLKNENES